MFEDIYANTYERSCANCWWSSGMRGSDSGDNLHCTLHNQNQAVYMWCEKWIERTTRIKG